MPQLVAVITSQTGMGVCGWYTNATSFGHMDGGPVKAAISILKGLKPAQVSILA